MLTIVFIIEMSMSLIFGFSFNLLKFAFHTNDFDRVNCITAEYYTKYVYYHYCISYRAPVTQWTPVVAAIADDDDASIDLLTRIGMLARFTYILK